jgi:hypothetical protein
MVLSVGADTVAVDGTRAGSYCIANELITHRQPS